MRLEDLADVFRSKNAGPFLITIDLMFQDEGRFRHVASSKALTTEEVARRYGIEAGQVRIIPFPRAKAIKITLPRRWGACGAGSVGDRDVYGAQQHGPLLDLEIPD